MDPLPYPALEDRWAFLELLLSAKESLHFLFEENPSCLLLELKNYVQENYQIELLIKEHPLTLFFMGDEQVPRKSFFTL